MLRGAAMPFQNTRCVEVKAETTTPGELRAGNADASRARRHLPKLEFVVDEQGAVLHGPQRAAYPFFHNQSSMFPANAPGPELLRPRMGEDNQTSGDGGAAESRTLAMKECILNDSRATTLAIKYDNSIGKFVCGSSIERFSGHTGVCRVLGSKKYPVIPHKLQVGDLLRIGSVGLVVCEMNRTADEATQEALTEEEYQFLKEHYLSLPLQQTFHPPDGRLSHDGGPETQNNTGDNVKETIRAGETSDEGESEEDHRANESDNSDDYHGIEEPGHRAHASSRATATKRFCYICYDDEDEPEVNPLVAPCNCKGDTKYVHLECLLRWNNNLDADNNKVNQKVCAVINTDGLDVCTICKATYSTSVRLDDGRIVSLLAKKLPPPYVTFAVVTQHETRNRSTALTNTRFQLSFANLPKNQPYLTIGRSTANDMTLRYRTVSQLHARIKHENNQFTLYDTESSNGTMLFMSRPLELDWGNAVHVKIGRTILTLKAKERWRWSSASNEHEEGMAEQTQAEDAANHPQSSASVEIANDSSKTQVKNRFLVDLHGSGSRIADPSVEWLASSIATNHHYRPLGSPSSSRRCPYMGRTVDSHQVSTQSPFSSRLSEPDVGSSRMSDLFLADELSGLSQSPRVGLGFSPRSESGSHMPLRQRTFSSSHLATRIRSPNPRLYVDNAADRLAGALSYLNIRSPRLEVAPVPRDQDPAIHEF